MQPAHLLYGVFDPFLFFSSGQLLLFVLGGVSFSLLVVLGFVLTLLLALRLLGVPLLGRWLGLRDLLLLHGLLLAQLDCGRGEWPKVAVRNNVNLEGREPGLGPLQLERDQNGGALF